MFTSAAVEHAVEDIGGRIADSQLGTLFQNALPNTLDTTVVRCLPHRCALPTSPTPQPLTAIASPAVRAHGRGGR